MRRIVAVSLLVCTAVVSAMCGGGSGPSIPSWARPDDAQLTHSSDCNAGKERCSVEYLTSTPWKAVSVSLTARLQRRGWSVKPSSAGLGATQFLRAEPPDADVCLHYSFIPNTDFRRPVPSVEPGREWIADEVRLRAQYSLIVAITARPCDFAIP